MTISLQNLRYISQLVDEIALDKSINWEMYNYDAVKEVAIQGVLEVYFTAANDKDQSAEEKEISALAIMSYLVLENTVLHIENLRLKQK
jgi:hypothetical protein